MTAPGPSRQRWLPALGLPLLAMVTVVALSRLANLGEDTARIERKGAIARSAQSVTAPRGSASAPAPRVSAAPSSFARKAPLAVREQTLQVQAPELRKGFSPVLDRVELAREPSGDDVIPNPPRTEPPTAREVNIATGTAPSAVQ